LPWALLRVGSFFPRRLSWLCLRGLWLWLCLRGLWLCLRGLWLCGPLPSLDFVALWAAPSLDFGKAKVQRRLSWLCRRQSQSPQSPGLSPRCLGLFALDFVALCLGLRPGLWLCQSPEKAQPIKPQSPQKAKAHKAKVHRRLSWRCLRQSQSPHKVQGKKAEAQSLKTKHKLQG